ncbi:MAG: hypothetical protein ILP12_00040 [Lachnospiraceae bacterium]|nr:hypothetical protein [Lachnospiraceae bacterium]
MSMFSMIKTGLARCGADEWRIRRVREESAELFFVGRDLDTRRAKSVLRYEVSVFVRVMEGEDVKKGMTEVTVLPSMSQAEIDRLLADARFAAGFVLNPDYAPADPVQHEPRRSGSRLAAMTPAEAAGEIAAALFAADVHPHAFLNSAEIFAVSTHTHILSSEGTDVRWDSHTVRGEFVVQCKEPEDVEIYRSFSYDEPETEALQQLAAEALDFVYDRARARKILKSGEYDLILSGNEVGELLGFYAMRSNAGMIYAGMSRWQPGETVQSEGSGERLDLTLCAQEPYSEEGIPMEDRPLLRGGVLCGIHGGNRFCRYLGAQPTGDYRRIRCTDPGTASFEELKQGPCLWAVTFSDFQMNPMSGHFGGEIRLAYLIENGRAVPVTGGSVNGSLLAVQGDLAFSRERFRSSRYEGPYAVRMKGIPVAGTEGEET